MANPLGYCSAPSCVSLKVKGDLRHILAQCISLHDTRARMLDYVQSHALIYPEISSILTKYADVENPDFVQFFLIALASL